MKATTKTIDPQVDADGICASQTPAAGGEQSLTINGALASDGAVTLTSAHKVDITSAGNDSGRTFTIVGKGERDITVTEQVTGANAGTATSTNYFSSITSITVDDDTAGAVTVGVNGAASSGWIPCDHNRTPFSLSFRCTVTGTVNYTVQDTLDDVQDKDATIVGTDHPFVAGETTTDDGTYDSPIRAVRCITASGDGSVEFDLIQAGLYC